MISSIVAIVIGILGAVVILQLGLPFGAGVMFIVMFEAAILSLFLLGIIGPQGLRDRMKRFRNFFSHDSTVFLPYDYTKPSGEALEEMVTKPATLERTKSAARVFGWYVLITVFIMIALFFFVGFMVSRGGH